MIVGIDPGLSGAIATIRTYAVRNRTVVRVMPFPIHKLTKSKKELDEQVIAQFLIQRKGAIEHIFMEKVHSMPGQGVSSCFTFGCGWGLLRGMFTALQIPYTLVRPTTWKKVMCRDQPKGKDASIIVAKRLWPTVSLLPTSKSRKDNDGMADALLIAEYGRRSLQGG